MALNQQQQQQQQVYQLANHPISLSLSLSPTAHSMLSLINHFSPTIAYK